MPGPAATSPMRRARGIEYGGRYFSLTLRQRL